MDFQRNWSKEDSNSKENSVKGSNIRRNANTPGAKKDDGSTLECGTDDGLNSGAVNKYTRNQKYNQTAFVHLNINEDNITRGRGCEINSLEDSLKYFKLEHYLQSLEVSLEVVRRHRNDQKVMDAHNALIQRFDKDMLRLSKEHHPDKIQSRNGSEEDVLRAQRLQTALNATRKAMSILNKIFLEDIDIDHKYGFYTKLDIGSLGNEDEIEGHVHEVLFKICLISEIKHCHIIAEIRKFLAESRSCIASYVEGNVEDFDKYLSSSFFRLKQAIGGYNKLFRELKEVEEESRAENLDNICSLIRSMRYNCSEQLNHLKQLLTMTELCSKGSFGIFTCSEYIDEYFVYPFVSYVNFILMCDVFQKMDNRRKSKKLKIISDPVFNEQTTFLASAYYLTSYYGGSKLHEHQVKMLLGQKLADQNSVKEKFLGILLQINDELIKKFKMDEYSASGGKKYILEELKKCKEMMSKFEETKRNLARDIALVKKDTEKMNQQIDIIMSDQEELGKQHQAHLAETADFQARFENLMKDIKEINQQPEKMKGDRRQCLKEDAASVLKVSEFQTRSASTSDNAKIGNQQVDSLMSEQKDCRKQPQAHVAESSDNQTRFDQLISDIKKMDDKCKGEEQLKPKASPLYENSEIQSGSAHRPENVAIENDRLEKLLTEQKRRKLYEACLAKHSELQAIFSNSTKNTK